MNLRRQPLRAICLAAMLLPVTSRAAPTMAALSTLIDTRISPDAASVLYVLTYPTPAKHAYHTELWQVSARGGTPSRLTSAEENASQPKWAPSGDKFAFRSDRAGSPQLWIQSREGSAAKPLDTLHATITAYEWAPDGRTIAFTALKNPDSHDGVGSAQYQILSVVDVSTQQVRSLTTEAFNVTSFSWSPSGKEIVLAHQPSMRPIDEFNSDIDVVDVASGSLRALVHRPGKDGEPHWSPDGRSVAFVSRNGERGEFATEDIFVIAASGGSIHDVTPQVGERNYGFYGWSSDSREVLFRIRRGVTMQLLAATVASGKVRPLSDGLKVYDSFSFSRGRAQVMAFAATDASHPKELFLAPVPRFDAAQRLVAHEGSASSQPGVTSVFHWKATDGTFLEGILTLPAGAHKTGPYPLVVALHGGPSGAFTIGVAPQIAAVAAAAELEPYPPQSFAACGIALFMPNIRGSGGYGEAFRKAVIGDWGGADYRDILAGIDALRAAGIADVDRLGVAGWSYGGYMAAWSITQSHRFKAASVGAGVSNLVSWYGLTDQPDMAEAYFRGAPWDQTDLYVRRSPVLHMQEAATPTLIQHGEHDEAVPYPQALELKRALDARHIEARLQSFANAGHVVADPVQTSALHDQNVDWFVTHLNPPRESAAAGCHEPPAASAQD